MRIINESTWKSELRKFPYQHLDQNLETDVVIIGGGIAGIMAAYHLAKAKQRVVVIEANQLLHGATVLTTAFLTHVIDTDFQDLISMYGPRKAKLIWQSHKEAITLIEKIVRHENISCDFQRCSNFVFANDADEFKQLKEEYQAIKKHGFPVLLKTKGHLGFKHSGFLELKNQAKFHPIKFLNGLIKAADKLGVQFYQNTTVTKIAGTSQAIISTKKNQIKANYALTATYDPLNNPKETFMKKGMYKSYVFEVQIPRNLISPGTYEDSRTPYHYFRVDRQAKFDRMIIGGEDNRFELAVADRKNFKALEEYLKNLLPGKRYTIVRKWTGPILEPSDGLALIGKFRPSQLIATAFSGNGMTYSGIAATIIRDIVLKRKNPWANLYDPTRTPSVKQLTKKAFDYAEEFFGGVVKNVLK
jgi:glycine/D-amino acid oxidase-like deaminating enzyme